MGGSSIGVLFGAQAVGGALGPLLGGMVADQYGLLATFYLFAGMIVVREPVRLLGSGARERFGEASRIDIFAR